MKFKPGDLLVDKNIKEPIYGGLLLVIEIGDWISGRIFGSKSYYYILWSLKDSKEIQHTEEFIDKAFRRLK